MKEFLGDSYEIYIYGEGRKEEEKDDCVTNARTKLNRSWGHV